MANKNLEFKIAIDADATGQREVQDLLRQLQGLKQFGNVRIGALDSIPGQANTATSSIGKLTRSFALLAAGIAAAKAVFDGFAAGVAANAAAQDRGLALTSLIASQYQLVDANGQVLEGQNAINAAKEKALQIETMLQKQSLASAASFSELLDAYRTVQAFGADLGTPEQLAELAPKLTDALKNFGFEGDAAASELKALFTGDQLDNAQFVRAQLGLTSKEQIESLKEQGKLLDFLNEKLATQALLSKDSAAGFSAQLGNSQEVVQKLGAELSKPLFASLTAGLTAFNNALIDADTGGLAESLDGLISGGQDIQAVFGTIVEDFLGGFVDRMQEISGFLDENYSQWIDITSGVEGVFAVVGEILGLIFDVGGMLIGTTVETGVWGSVLDGIVLLVGTIATGFEGFIALFQLIRGAILTNLAAPIDSVAKLVSGFLRAAGFDGLAAKFESLGATVAKIGAETTKSAKGTFEAFAKGDNALTRSLLKQEQAKQKSLERRIALERKRQGLDAKDSGVETKQKPKTAGSGRPGAKGRAGTAGEDDAGRIIEAQAALEEQRLENARKEQAAGYARQQKDLEAALSAKTITFEDYLNQRAALQKAELQIDRDATAGRIAALEAEVQAARDAGKTLTALKKEKELEKRVGELAALNEKVAEIDAVLLIDGKRASEAQIKLKADLEIDLQAKLGNAFEAEKGRIQKALADSLASDEVRGNAELEARVRERAAIEQRLAEQAQASLVIDRERTNLSLTQAEIERARVTGLLTGVEAEQRNRLAVQATTAAIEAKIAVLQELANASGADDDTPVLNQIRTLKGELEDLAIAANETAIRINRGFADNAAQGLSDFVRGTTDAKNALLGLLEFIINDFAKRSQQALSDAIFQKVSGQGGAGGLGKFFTDLLGGGDFFSVFKGMLGFATGGAVRGPGTGTSDSIVARLSNGEFVMRADAVRQIGLSNLDYLNRTGRLPAFADGGVVGAPPVAMGGGGGNIRIINAIETQDIVNAIDSPQGERVIKNIISRNPKFFGK